MLCFPFDYGTISLILFLGREKKFWKLYGSHFVFWLVSRLPRSFPSEFFSNGTAWSRLWRARCLPFWRCAPSTDSAARSPNLNPILWIRTRKTNGSTANAKIKTDLYTLFIYKAFPCGKRLVWFTLIDGLGHFAALGIIINYAEKARRTSAVSFFAT